MKYNLKNRPKLVGLLNGEYKSIADMLDKCLLWFEGFEAELREMLRRLQESGESNIAAEVQLQEILGE